MFTTTDAIVLSLQPHSDKAHVLHAYTRAGGRVNYMVYGLGKKNAAGMYMPLSLIRITADHSPSRPPTLKEASPSPFTFHRSPLTTDIYKQTIRLFIAEVLFHVLRHPMQDEPMFDFISESVRLLEEAPEPQNFHIEFLIGLAAKLGFAIDEQSDLNKIPQSRKERQEQLRQLCAYFEEHVETWKEPKSLDILIDVFD